MAGVHVPDVTQKLQEWTEITKIIETLKLYLCIEHSHLYVAGDLSLNSVFGASMSHLLKHLLSTWLSMRLDTHTGIRIHPNIHSGLEVTGKSLHCAFQNNLHVNCCCKWLQLIQVLIVASTIDLSITLLL